MVARLCLDRCGRLSMPGKPRCRPCYLAQQRARNAKPERRIYGGSWASTSRAIRQAVGECQAQGPGCTGRPDTLDHTTGLVACNVCHRPQAQGGIKRRVAA